MSGLVGFSGGIPYASQFFPCARRRPRQGFARPGQGRSRVGEPPKRPVGEIDREIALRALIREAEEYGADALVGVEFAVEEVKGADIEGVPLRRLSATGEAVRFKIAA